MALRGRDSDVNGIILLLRYEKSIIENLNARARRCSTHGVCVEIPINYRCAAVPPAFGQHKSPGRGGKGGEPAFACLREINIDHVFPARDDPTWSIKRRRNRNFPLGSSDAGTRTHARSRR